MPTDKERLAKYASEKLALEGARLSDSYYYQSLPLCIIDSVFSIGVRYGQVLNVIETFCRQTGWVRYRVHGSAFPAKADQQTVSNLLEVLGHHPNPEKSLFHNSGYANPAAKEESRILKANLVKQFAAALVAREIDTYEDLKSYPKPECLDCSLCGLPSLKSGVVVRYFRMLAGDDTQVKPDRMILRFLCEALGSSVGTDEAVELVRGASSILEKDFPGMNPRLLDHEIWKYQRGRSR